jgi:hypothetical protein
MHIKSFFGESTPVGCVLLGADSLEANLAMLCTVKYSIGKKAGSDNFRNNRLVRWMETPWCAVRTDGEVCARYAGDPGNPSTPVVLLQVTSLFLQGRPFRAPAIC